MLLLRQVFLVAKLSDFQEILLDDRAFFLIGKFLATDCRDDLLKLIKVCVLNVRVPDEPRCLLLLQQFKRLHGLFDFASAYEAPDPLDVSVQRSGILHDFFLCEEDPVSLHLDHLLHASESPVVWIRLDDVFLLCLRHRIRERAIRLLRLQIELDDILLRRHRVYVVGLVASSQNDVLVVAKAVVLLELFSLFRLSFVHDLGLLEYVPVSHLTEAERLH